jgi:hypothetical protein
LKELFFERLMHRVDDAAETPKTFEQRVTRCVSTYIEVAVERPHHYLAAFATSKSSKAGHETAEDWRQFQTTMKGQAFGTVVALVQEGQTRGDFDNTIDAHTAAKSWWASMHGLALLLIHLPAFPAMMPHPTVAPSPASFIEFHASLMMRSLRPVQLARHHSFLPEPSDD